MTEAAHHVPMPHADATQPTLVVTGSIHYDVIIQLPRLPEENDRITPTAMTLTPGGMGGNVAAAFARLGGNVRFVGQFSADADGDNLREDLARDGVDLGWAGERPAGTNHRGMILVDAEGRRAILGAWPEVHSLERAPGQHPGLVRHLQQGMPRNALSRFRDMLTFDAAVFDATNVAFAAPFNFAPFVLPMVPKGCPVYMDIETGHITGWEDEEVWAMLRRTTVLYGNQRNLTDLARRLDEPSVTALSRTLKGTIVETAGALGALIHERGNRTVIPGFPTEAIDTTGAGDCFAGACTLALLRGLPIHEAVRFANAAASLSTRMLGSRPGVPTMEEVERLLIGNHAGAESRGTRSLSEMSGAISRLLGKSGLVDDRQALPTELLADPVGPR